MTVLYIGQQCTNPGEQVFTRFRQEMVELFNESDKPDLYDFAVFTDTLGFKNQFAVAYWTQHQQYKNWSTSSAMTNWWSDADKNNGTVGYFWEAFECSVDHTETVAFKEYIRGLSACPSGNIKATGESGYWGAARDRIPASGHDRLDSSLQGELVRNSHRRTSQKRVRINPPTNLVLIRSGVSWEDCGEEQLDSYQKNLRPALDLGMEYLRQNPIESGCCHLRQVDVITDLGESTCENYCAGYFLSLKHLEHWVSKHPTHLEIFGQAQKERIRYQENLELKTYHEVYVIDKSTHFEYINCHHETGLLPYFDLEELG